MKVTSASLLQEMQRMAQQSGGSLQAQSAIAQDMPSSTVTPTGNNAGQNFGQLLADAINNVNSLQSQTNDLRTRFDLGDKSVSIGDVMIAAQKSSIAFDATVEVRNKVTDAYKEIMSMPI
ncbi:flagellar hook-basal body complex protein FliE [Celerinatantimonas sp. YJH-8]|uniref:flagellar hook-basal body complex protein FliE n=1 Tax=Celerinatantimonas sp. YJH-8 TaxID=3228714 RepID=UPI0038C8DA90